MADQTLDQRGIVIIGSQPEALLLSVLFAEAKVPNRLVGPFEPKDERRVGRSALDEASWLLSVHKKNGTITLVEDVEEAPVPDSGILVLTSHARNQQDTTHHERTIRKIAKTAPKNFNFTYTGLSRPGYASAMGETLHRYTGLRVGPDIGLCYLPLLWNGESLKGFREAPRIVAGTEEDAVATVQDSFLRVFPSISSTPRIRDAETAGLFLPIYRDVLGALQLELARLCVGQGVDYADALGLCRGVGMNSLGSPRPFPGLDSVGSEIALNLLRSGNNPLVIRAARRVNEESQNQVLAMVRSALAKCGHRLRHSKIAVLGLDGLGVNTRLKPEPPEVLQTLKRRGALLSIYPGSNFHWITNIAFGEHIRVEHSVTKAVERAHCALIALQHSEDGELNPQKLASEMTHPAAICDLTGVMEASNVERAGLLYTSIGRGSSEA